MDQISRPFQIALVAVGLLACVWVFALRGHSSSTPEATSSAPAAAPATSASAASASTPAAEEKAAAAPSKVYNGSAPGVKGLSSAIAKAHGAVAISQRNAAELQSKSDQASSSAAAPAAASAAPAATSVTKTSTSVTVSKGAASHTTTVTKVTAGAPAGQQAVESALAKGNIVVVMFWNPSGSDDKAVRAELRLLEIVHDRLRPERGNPKVKALVHSTGLQLMGKIAVLEALPGQVTSYGSITRGVQVNQTPTLLVINKHGQTITLTGLQDAYAIEQAIDEVRAG